MSNPHVELHLHARSSLRSLLFAVWTLLVPTTVALAQDDFDAEFADPPPTAAAAQPAASGDGFDAEFAAPAEQAPAEEAVSDAVPADDAEAVESAPEGAEDLERSARSRALSTTFNTYFGPAGGLHVVDAAPGEVGVLRAQLVADFFFSNGFIRPEDDAKHIGGSLSIAAAVHDMVEVWASMQSYANSNAAESPSLFQVLGDLQLGVKVGFRPLPFLSVGADASFTMLNTVGDIGLVFASTGVGIRANASLDLRNLSNPVPFLARLNLQYYFNNSSALVEDVESARYRNLMNPRAESDEWRHLVSSVERFALQINRTDFFNVGLGFEAPFEVASNFYLSPLLEWNWKIPVNRQGFDCIMPYDSADSDGCLDGSGVSNFPMDLTLGLRVAPPVRGLGILLAADIGLTGKSSFVRELAANAPYNVYIGLSYAYDTTPIVPTAIVREVEREAPIAIASLGRIHGRVVEAGAGTPAAGAIIRFPGRELTALYANDAGEFTTYALAPGDVAMEITHDEYQPGSCTATIPEPSQGEESSVEVTCELTALPRVGTLRGRVLNGETESGVAGAQVQISGATNRSVTSGPDGSFTAADIPPGAYIVRVDAETFLIRTETVNVVPREPTALNVTLVPRPRNALVQVRGREIRIRRQVNFATDSAEILPSSEGLMTEIADVLMRSPQIARVEIQGHTDDRGSAAHNRELSAARAQSVREWLVAHGIAGERLESQGYGPDRPLVPNITAGNRAKNRRVQFMILEQGEASAE